MFDSTAGHVVKADPTINPTKPEEHWCYEAMDVLYLVQRTDHAGKVVGRAVLRSCGTLGVAWAPGTKHDVYNDQSGKHLGYWEVVGVKSSDGEVGEIFNRKVNYYVFK